ncbi:MAG: DUF4838 domain-containing protein [Clostridia bacterium]|nr:DUF4838 domain-containing protein [Clostridia bacterium]
MKKIISMFFILGFMFSTFTVCADARDDGALLTDYTIVIDSEPTDTERFAAERLEYYIEKVTKKDIPFIYDSYSDGKYEILVADVTTESSVDGSYVISSNNSCISIGGYGNKGTIYAVYRFLEEFCDCRWFEKNVIRIPENPDLRVPSDILVEYTPFFEYTEADTLSACDPEYSLANGLNGGAYRNLSHRQGYMVEYLGPFGHSLATYYCSPDKYFDEHPEYFALRGKKRVKDQLCLTNFDVMNIVTDEVLALLEQSYVPNVALQIVSLTQNDNLNYCECEDCRKIDKNNGSQSGTLISFVNEIAKRVADTAKYPNIAFDTFAYQYSRKAPTNVVPRDDVIVRLCSIECCFGHTMDDTDCKVNADFMKDLEEWSKICDRIYIWDYVNNYNETVCIFPNFNVLQRNVQIFYENHAKGLYEEGNYYITQCDGEFAELRTYLLSKLMQNPYRDDSEELIDDYLEAVYGPGYQSIREFIDIMSEHAVSRYRHLSIYQDSDDTLCNMSSKDVERCDELWQKAKDAAENDQQLNEILHSELSWRY